MPAQGKSPCGSSLSPPLSEIIHLVILGALIKHLLVSPGRSSVRSERDRGSEPSAPGLLGEMDV